MNQPPNWSAVGWKFCRKQAVVCGTCTVIYCTFGHCSCCASLC